MKTSVFKKSLIGMAVSLSATLNLGCDKESDVYYAPSPTPINISIEKEDDNFIVSEVIKMTITERLKGIQPNVYSVTLGKSDSSKYKLALPLTLMQEPSELEFAFNTIAFGSDIKSVEVKFNKITYPHVDEKVYADKLVISTKKIHENISRRIEQVDIRICTNSNCFDVELPTRASAKVAIEQLSVDEYDKQVQFHPGKKLVKAVPYGGQHQIYLLQVLKVTNASKDILQVQTEETGFVKTRMFHRVRRVVLDKCHSMLINSKEELPYIESKKLLLPPTKSADTSPNPATLDLSDHAYPIKPGGSRYFGVYAKWSLKDYEIITSPQHPPLIHSSYPTSCQQIPQACPREGKIKTVVTFSPWQEGVVEQEALIMKSYVSLKSRYQVEWNENAYKFDSVEVGGNTVIRKNDKTINKPPSHSTFWEESCMYIGPPEPINLDKY